jgi:hypothetical protein
MLRMTSSLLLAAAVFAAGATPAAAGLPGSIVIPAFDLAGFQADFEAAAVGAFFISEADYRPEFLAAELSAEQLGAPVDAGLVLDVLGADVEAFFAREESPLALADMAFFDAGQDGAAELLLDLATAFDQDDEFVVESAAAFARINTLLSQNLTDITAVKIGPKDDDGSLDEDSGLYAWVFVGKTPAGHLAGFLVGTVET